MNEYSHYIESDFSQYVGHWIGIWNKKVVATGKSFKEVAEKVDRDFSHKKVLITRIPHKLAHIL